MTESLIRIFNDWSSLLEPEFQKSYMKQLKEFLTHEKNKGKQIYPKNSQIFNALNATSFKDTKVIILGQDPYHGLGQAHGLSFSVPHGVPLPPSLLNIFKEIRSDLNIPISKNGDLTPWAKQGVLLLNATLTVENNKAGSHQNKGWETFTDSIISLLNNKKNNLVFLLWGSFAQKKGAFIDSKKHLVLKSPHPSPLSAYRGFFGCKHFSLANQYLRNHGNSPIDWRLE